MSTPLPVPAAPSMPLLGFCFGCGRDAVLDVDGTAYHLLPDGLIDHTTDGDHPAWMDRIGEAS